MKASSRKVKQENMMDLFELGMLYDVEDTSVADFSDLLCRQLSDGDL